MKIINKTLIFLFVALFSRSIDIDIKSPQCAIGSIEAEHFAKANHKIPLISYSDFSNNIENLIRYDQRFTNTSFINTQLINIAPDTLVLKNGSCVSKLIQITIKLNQSFLSQTITEWNGMILKFSCVF